MLIKHPTSQIVYEPKVKYHVDNKVPPRTSDSFLGWVSPLLHTKEPELVDKIGLDAAIYPRFILMCRSLFSTHSPCSPLGPSRITELFRTSW